MSEELRMYVEVGFNILYLIVVWTMTVIMSMNMEKVSKENRSIASLFRWAFVLLAVGDTGHVGFRVAAYVLGGLENNGLLVGIGALATAITVTFFMWLCSIFGRNDSRESSDHWNIFCSQVCRSVLL